MDSIGGVEEGEWRSEMSGMFITEESDFIAQLLTNQSTMNTVSAIDEASCFMNGGNRLLRSMSESNIHSRPRIQSEPTLLDNSKKRSLSSENDLKTKNQTRTISSEDGNGGNNGQTESSGKTRAMRGSATDPQSLYARKRRERINERLRILQSLVPNGSKVDLSTMLEEAVEYVKFLQLQIKLLSSDDLWMYAPIAYNGMDLGLDTRQSHKGEKQTLP